MMSPVPVTLLITAAAVFFNAWLGSRIGRLRREYNISIGHADNEPLQRRMRAQANFIENTPFFVILLGALEASGSNQVALALVALAYFLSRWAHVIGMEGGARQSWRTKGIIGSFLATLVLALWGITCAGRALIG